MCVCVCACLPASLACCVLGEHICPSFQKLASWLFKALSSPTQKRPVHGIFFFAGILEHRSAHTPTILEHRSAHTMTATTAAAAAAATTRTTTPTGGFVLVHCLHFLRSPTLSLIPATECPCSLAFGGLAGLCWPCLACGSRKGPTLGAPCTGHCADSACRLHTRCLVLGAWCRTHGAWCLVPHTRCLVLGGLRGLDPPIGLARAASDYAMTQFPWLDLPC